MPMGGLQELKTILADKEKRIVWLQKHRASLQAWSAFCIASVLVFIVFSDGDYSFLLTLSSLVSTFSFLMVIFKIETAKSVSGVSLRMMECYLILLLARLCSIVPFEGYLPYDRTGDWLYQVTEAVSFCLAGTIVYLCRSRYASTYDSSADTFNHLFLIVPVAILASLFHPSLNAFMPADIAWTFALYLEAFSSLPQLFMFQKEGKVEPHTSHFLAAQASAKVLSFSFWFSTYAELNDPTKRLKSYVGVWVMIMQVIQLVIMCDFIYHYIRCLSRGVPVQYMMVDAV